MKRDNARAVAWVILYCFLVVLISATLVELRVPPSIIVPVALFVLPLLASVPFLAWDIYAGNRRND